MVKVYEFVELSLFCKFQLGESILSITQVSGVIQSLVLRVRVINVLIEYQGRA